MKIVIDVPRDFCEKMRNQNGMSYTEAEVVVDAFYKGTLLRCVLDEMRREIKEYTFKAYGTKFIYIDRLNHIINKAESEESNGTL